MLCHVENCPFASESVSGRCWRSLPSVLLVRTYCTTLRCFALAAVCATAARHNGCKHAVSISQCNTWIHFGPCCVNCLCPFPVSACKLALLLLRRTFQVLAAALRETSTSMCLCH
eukprot:COSAG06_NODE_147_length_22091_cov_70.669880_24_plen_115_part_00